MLAQLTEPIPTSRPGPSRALRLWLLHVNRGDLFGSLLRQEVAFFDKEEVGVLTSRLGSDCQAVVRALSTNINVALRNALQAVGRLHNLVR